MPRCLSQNTFDGTDALEALESNDNTVQLLVIRHLERDMDVAALVVSGLGPDLADIGALLRDRVGQDRQDPLTVFRLDTELHNLYGPTEAAVDVTYWPCRADSDRSIVPIGYPVANTQIYILDPRLSPVPIGCIGELHICGVQVARGYLNRSELSAEKFIPDPFSGDPAARLYKTGDLARYLADGSIEYLGRIDFQVKIRGLRVELGEIEARLAELDAVDSIFSRPLVTASRSSLPEAARIWS